MTIGIGSGNTHHVDARTPWRRGRNVLIYLGLAVVALAVIVVAILWFVQRSMIYFPDTSEVPPADQVLVGGQDIVLTTSDGHELDAWFAPPAPEADDRDMAVLMAPGNGGNRESRAGLAQHMQDQGFAVLLLEYRGYSTNPGSPTEDGLSQDALAAVDELEAQGYQPGRTIYFGESIGTGVVAALLEEHSPAAVVLRSPFPELADVGRHHYPWAPVRTILRDNFPISDQIRETKVPVSVIRAEDDTVIPTLLSSGVAQAAPELVDEHVIEQADHNDPVMFGPEIAEVVARTADAVEE